MGHDLYIQARIREKRNGWVISHGDSDDYAAEENKGFFDICWWCGSPECDVRFRMVEICSSHGVTGYTDSDLFIPIPPSALRAVYAHVVSCCCFPENKSFPNLALDTRWMNPHDRNAYEKANLLNADKLHDLIATLDEINDENKVLDACFLYKEYIPDEKDLRHFYENPLAYEWEFRIWNSY